MDKLGDILAQLLKAREEIVARLQDVDDAIAQIQALNTKLNAGLKPFLETQTHPSTELNESLQISGNSAETVLAPSQIAASVRDILQEKNRPMKRGELVQELRQRGVPLYGKDINKNIGTIIWRHPHLFTRVGALGYWLKDVPLAGVYEPEAE